MAESSNLSSQKDAAPNDPVTRLHRMSTTAGVGSQDYVAINNVAIASALLGIATLLALFGNALLIIPAVAIICGIVALRQIRLSSGTQSGRIFAWGGIALSLLISGWIISAQLSYALRARGDRAAIVQVITDLGSRARDNQWEQAYELFTDDFHKRVALDAFSQRLKVMLGNEVVGSLARTGSNNIVNFDYSHDDDTRAVALIEFYFSKSDQPAPELGTFYKTPRGWLIGGIGDLFVDPNAPPPPDDGHGHSH